MTTAVTSKCSVAGTTGGSGRRRGREASSVARFLERLLSWSDRLRQRHQLSSMDDRLLKDIGLTSADVEFEVGKPFWRL